MNLLHLFFDPNSLRRVIVNWEACAKALLNEAYRRLALARDDMLKALISDILKYPGVPARWREPELEGPQALILPIELNLNGKIARMFSTVTSVATPHDVTLQELQVEVSYPANAETEARVLTGPYRMFSQPGGLWANRVFDLFRLVHPRQADSV